MSRITEQFLSKQVENLNLLLSKHNLKAGFTLDFAYGGICLRSSDYNDVFYSGYIKKSALSELISAYYKGITLALEPKQ